MKPNAGRTINGIPKHAREQAANPILRIDGQVEVPRALTLAESLALPHERYLDGEQAPNDQFIPPGDWSGPTLATLIAGAGPLPGAAWLHVSAGPYAVAIPIGDAPRVLACDTLDGQPLPVDRGGPWRLIIPDRGYNMGVKWVDRIEVCLTEPDDSAIRIAEARERARQYHRAREDADKP